MRNVYGQVSAREYAPTSPPAQWYCETTACTVRALRGPVAEPGLEIFDLGFLGKLPAPELAV